MPINYLKCSLIIATALNHDLPVISSDEQFRRYKNLQIVW